MSNTDTLVLGALGFNVAYTAPPDDTWTGAVDNDFNKAGNWDELQVPTATSDAIIGGSASVTVDTTGTDEVDSLLLAVGATLAIDSGHFVIDNGAKSSSIAGKLNVNAVGTEIDLKISGTIFNDGQLSLVGPGAHLLTNDIWATAGVLRRPQRDDDPLDAMRGIMMATLLSLITFWMPLAIALTR
jgi:hypothetical protein